MGRRQQSESIEVALDMEARSFGEPFRHWSVPLFVKYRITCVLLTLQEQGFFLYQPISSRCSRLVGPDMPGFCYDLDPCWLSTSL